MNTIEQRITNLEHQNEIIIRLLKETQSHLWTNKDGRFWEPKKPEKKVDELALEEAQAINYVNNVVIPKTEQKKAEGIVGVEGFWDAAILNYVKQQAIVFIGTTLKELAIKGLVDLSKWLLEQAEKTILNLYRNASQEEKELFKNKVQETFPDSPFLEKL